MDAKADRGEDITPWLDLENAVVVRYKGGVKRTTRLGPKLIAAARELLAFQKGKKKLKVTRAQIDRRGRFKRVELGEVSKDSLLSDRKFFRGRVPPDYSARLSDYRHGRKTSNRRRQS